MPLLRDHLISQLKIALNQLESTSDEADVVMFNVAETAFEYDNESLDQPIDMIDDSLIPPDYDNCQAMIPSGNTFMTFGGRVGDMRQCTNTPTFILVEPKAGPDGKIGAMSVCDECKDVFIKQSGEDGAIIKKIGN